MDWRLKGYAPVAPLRSIAVMAIVLAGCVHSSSAFHARRAVNYWEALADLHPDEARTAAHNESEREFAEALANLMDGDLEKAEQRFGMLRATATDSIIRSGSRVIYTATLQYQEKWATLADSRASRRRPLSTAPIRRASS